MLYSDVFADAVSAPRAAAQSERRGKTEVVQVADAALRRRRVDKHAAGFHTALELVKFCPFRYFVEIYGRRMTVATVCNKSFSLCEGVLNILRAVHCKYGRKFFVREFFRQVDAFDLAD